MQNDIDQILIKNSIFRIGEVYSVDGRTTCVKVDRDKNLSHLIYQGELVKNVSVGGYIKILKGFVQIIAKVESENIKENKNIDEIYHHKTDEINRFLFVKLIGYFEDGKYYKGVKELPLIGNVCLLLDNEEFSKIHKFANDNEPTVQIGHLMVDENIAIEISIDKLFTSHIGIFGNTGSGKSYTLANLYKHLFEQVSNIENFKKNARFLLFDFNGEYSGADVITSEKRVYNITTRSDKGDKIPLTKEDILKPELVYILASATEKTQQPFIRRTIKLYSKVQSKDNPLEYTKGILRKLVTKIVCMSDYVKAKLLLDYMEQILPRNYDEKGIDQGLQSDLYWHGQNKTFYIKACGNESYINGNEDSPIIQSLVVFKAVNDYTENENFIDEFVRFMYVQLIEDVLNNRAANEHIAPAIKKLQSIESDFQKVFVVNERSDFWCNRFFVVLNLNETNLNIKKLVPLLVSTKLYNEHKKSSNSEKYLNIIIDEAHNILSY